MGTAHSEWRWVLPVRHLLKSAGTVVGEYTRGGVKHVASGPASVGHPEILNHVGLTGVVSFEQLAVEHALLGEGLREGAELALFEVLVVGVARRSRYLLMP